MSSVCWKTTAQTPTTSQSIQITSTLADGFVIFNCLPDHMWSLAYKLCFLCTLLCQIADGQRELIRSHSVKNRHFIGNTSMDAGLSLIMTNHAKVKKNDFVFDPFVGTGGNLPFLGTRTCLDLWGMCRSMLSYFWLFFFRESVGCVLPVWCLRLWSRYWLQHYSWQRSVLFDRVSCASPVVLFHYFLNQLCLSGRSSRKNQKWRGPDENIRANLRQYGTENLYLDVMVSDASKSVWRKTPVFDAIITDRRWQIWGLVVHVLVCVMTSLFFCSPIWDPWVHEENGLPQRQF